MNVYRKICTIITLLTITGFAFNASAQLADHKILTTEAVKNIISAAEAEAVANDWNVVIAVVDDGGHLLGLLRLNNAQTASIDIAIGKARTAAGFRRPTLALQDMIPNRPAFLSVSSDLVLLEGGMPIIVDGRTLGAVGVSGVASNQDAQIATAGIAALRP